MTSRGLPWTELNVLNDLAGYRRHFMDAALWAPFVRLACKSCGLECSQVKPGLPGTFPTFIVDQNWVVKFYGRWFDGEASFQAELHANQIIAKCPQIRTAQLVAEGKLPEMGAGWRWRFLIFQFLPGVSLGEVFNELSGEDKLSIAHEMGEMIRALHALPVLPGPVFQPSWRPSLAEFHRLIAACVKKHRRWRALPQRLIEQIGDFVVPPDQLIDLRQTPYLIHADLTGDHLLGKFKEGVWQTMGIIDWGDAWVGGFYYELTALYLDMFRAEPVLLRAFLEAYAPPPDLMENFSRRFLSAALIHRFNLFIGEWFSRRPELCDVSTLEDMAELLVGALCMTD